LIEHNQRPNFEQAFLPHLDTAYNLARWLMRNEQDAQDVVQESFLRALQYYPALRGRNARPWLMKIVRNTCYTRLQENQPLHDAIEFDENLAAPDSRVPNPENAVLQNERAALVRKAVEGLPTNLREVLILRELEGMSYKAIAEITGMRAGTVMSSLSRARGRLRRGLTGFMNGDAVHRSPRAVAVKTVGERA
jgi:RNA polymerase sigma-70 factor (ECF subfamily)